MHGRDTQNELERATARLLRRLRAGRGVPAPGTDDPADEALLRYVEGTAAAAERRDVEARLERSALARDLVAILGAATAAPRPVVEAGAARWVFVLGRDVLQFLRGTTAPLATAGAAAVRGRAAGPATTYELAARLGAVDAAVVVDRAQDRVDVRLTLSAAGAPVADARVALTRDGRLVASSPTEADGGCTFPIGAAGRYALEVRRGGRAVGTVRLDLLREDAGA